MGLLATCCALQLALFAATSASGASPSEVAITSSMTAPSNFTAVEVTRAAEGEENVKAGKQMGTPLVVRNAIVKMEYSIGALRISTVGRAMSPGNVGEVIKIMNLASRTIVPAVVIGPATVEVK